MPAPARLFRIDNPYRRKFCAGVLVHPRTGLIVKTAPILYWTRGKPISWLIRYCQSEGWEILEL